MSAILKAAITRSSSRLAAIAHPMTFRENTSSTAAKYNHPWLVQTPVMSVTHFSFGRSAVNARFSRLGAIGKEWWLSVVQVRRCLRRADKPRWCIKRAIRFREQGRP